MATVFLSNEKSFPATESTSLLDAAQISSLILEHSCRTGRCGTCRAKILEGSVRSCGDDSGLSLDEKRAGWILTCTSAAASDIVRLDIEDISVLASFPMRTLPCRIDSIEAVKSDVVLLQLRFPPSASLRYLAGQYVDVVAKGGVRRSYSIANKIQSDGKIELHIRKVDGGFLSQYWFGDAKKGDLLRIEGPKGSFFLRDVAGADLILLATGTGIAPIKAMLADLQSRVKRDWPRSIALYWGGRHSSDMYWLPPADIGLKFVPVVSQGDVSWLGARGHVQDALLAERPELSNAVVYACGSSAMIESARQKLSTAGLPANKFFSDAFVSSAI